MPKYPARQRRLRCRWLSPIEAPGLRTDSRMPPQPRLGRYTHSPPYYRSCERSTCLDRSRRKNVLFHPHIHAPRRSLFPNDSSANSKPAKSEHDPAPDDHDRTAHDDSAERLEDTSGQCRSHASQFRHFRQATRRRYLHLHRKHVVGRHLFACPPCAAVGSRLTSASRSAEQGQPLAVHYLK